MATPAQLKALRDFADSRVDVFAIAAGAPQEVFTAPEKEDVLRVLTAASDLEDGLEAAILTQIRSRNSDMRQRMFGFGGPIGTFSNKIMMAYALGLLTDESHARFEAVRALRNAFAHARRGLSFETPEVRAVVRTVLTLENVPDDTSGIRTAWNVSIMKLLLELLAAQNSR